jgi:CheY-like chemotaxis protein
MARSILVIDDDEACREAVVVLLNARGYEAVGVADGRAAIERVHSGGGGPAVILLDLMMPRMDGHEFLRLRETDPLLLSVPVIVLTATGTRRVSSSAPIAAIVQKPYKMKLLLQTVEAVLDDSAAAPEHPPEPPPDVAVAPRPSVPGGRA